MGGEFRAFKGIGASDGVRAALLERPVAPEPCDGAMRGRVEELFAGCSVKTPLGPRPIASLMDPDVARGLCVWVSDQVTEALLFNQELEGQTWDDERGPAWLDSIMEVKTLGFGAYVSLGGGGDVGFVAWVDHDDLEDEDDEGRVLEADHMVTALWIDEGGTGYAKWVVDCTASQFGAQAWPLVSRWDDYEVWVRRVLEAKARE